MGVALGGCGKEAEPGTEKQARALTGLENIITVDHAGYVGWICVANRGCATLDNRTIPLEDGTHTIQIYATSGIDSGGSITVSGQGTAVSLDATAEKYFLPLVATGTRATTLTPKTVTVRLDRAGFAGHLELYEAGAFVNNEARLIPSRGYQFYTAFSGALDANWLLGFDVDANGRVTVPDEQDRQSIRGGEGDQASTVIAQTVPVTLVRNGWNEMVAFYGSSDYFGATPSSTVQLLKGRRYDFYAPWSGPTLRFSTSVSSTSGFDFTVARDGTLSLNPDIENVLFRVVPGGLEALPVPVIVDMGGYAGATVMIGVAELTPFQTTAQLMRGRRYDIRLWNTAQLDSESAELADGYDITMRTDGVLTVDGEAQGSFEVVGDGRTLRARTMTLFYEANGYPEKVGLYGAVGLQSTGGVALKGRRYRVMSQSSHPFNGQAAFYGSGVQFFSAESDVTISPDGVISLSGGAAASFFAPNGGPVIHAQVSRLLVDAGGYTGSVCILNWPEQICGAAGAGLDQVVLRNRRYIVSPSGAPVDVDSGGSCQPGPLGPTSSSFSCFPGGGAPEAPAAFSARITSPSRVDLGWVDTSVNEAGFRVERRLEGETSWSPVTTCAVGANVTTCHDDTGLVRGSRYQYQITAYNVAGTAASAMLPLLFDAPEKPDTLVGDVSGPTSVTLQWADRSSTETGFEVERSTDAINFTRITTTAADVRAYTDPEAPSGTSHYRVRAINAIGASLPTNVVTIQLGAPGAPSLAQAQLVEWFGSSGYVHVTWTDNSAGESGFSIERRDGTGAFREVGVTGRDTGGAQGGLLDLVGAGTYSYRIRALSPLGGSAYSNEASIIVGPVPKPTLTATLVSGTRVDLT